MRPLFSPAIIRRAHRLQRSLGIEPDAPWLAKLLALFLRPGTGAEESATHQVRRLFPHVRFDKPSLGDLFRIPLQLMALLFVRFDAPTPSYPPQHRAQHWLRNLSVQRWLKQRRRTIIKERTRIFDQISRGTNALFEHTLWNSRLIRAVAIGAIAIVSFIPITTPLEPANQATFSAVLFTIALVAWRLPGRGMALLLIALSVLASTRYIWWRIAYTTYWDDPLAFAWGGILLAAEIYAWLMLLFGYFQSAWPLQRKPAPLPADRSTWPTVDVYIPTYNEPLTVVGPTVLAALAIDWPREKLRVCLLDDRRRKEMRDFAKTVGAQYIARPHNRHAKAGNLNHAMRLTDGEYIVIFDCDHVPTSGFLTTVMGWFLRNERLALIQTPHHFFSPDPFERNLKPLRKMPSEGDLFHRLIQDGNDLWNSTFFCGSCAVIRRGPLEEVGGIAIETVTEDAHTALRLQRRGYDTAMINIPLAAGLATESLSAYVGQRIRWARGMAQIFRIDNPFFGRGLRFAQRICYASAMMHFFNGGPRLIFLTAPLAFLVFQVYVIHASALEITLYLLPHLLHTTITNSRLHGRHRRTFWSDVYETVLAWYIVLPTTLALINPRYGKFNVTAKGGVMKEDRFEWLISLPLLLLAALNLFCFGLGIWRLGNSPADEIGTTLLNLGWTTFNLMMLGAAIAVAAERAQRRIRHRAKISVPIGLSVPDGHTYRGKTVDISSDGAALALGAIPNAQEGDPVTVSFQRENRDAQFTGRIIALTQHKIHLAWQPMTSDSESALVRCSFAKSDAWSKRRHLHQSDAPLSSLSDVAYTAKDGYRKLANYTIGLIADPLKPWLPGVGAAWHGFKTVLPHPPAAVTPAGVLPHTATLGRPT